ncbi:unnamed protein product [Arabis nemorensis]|uniref:F-box associated beta-propeller type 3 domain-containing protein n=1 Tax=Arabis nemorensis TaxID=586526 RepID=A0A565B453_9BRAS|nr:unnamed protein product [Arabis nemorensis]
MKKNNPQIVKRSRVKRRDEEGDENLYENLIIEILIKLPLKSVARPIPVSKLWYYTIRGKCFKDLFWTRSLTRPCFLIAFRCDEDWFFHTASHEPQSSLHSTTSTILNKDHRISQPIRGLICALKASKMVICNPCTGQVAALPNVKIWRRSISTFLGYDSVEHVHKILCMTVLNVSQDHEAVVSEEHQVLTLGDQKKRWRKIECQHPHCPATKGLFINGVIYYVVLLKHLITYLCCLVEL